MDFFLSKIKQKKKKERKKIKNIKSNSPTYKYVFHESSYSVRFQKKVMFINKKNGKLQAQRLKLEVIISL